MANNGGANRILWFSGVNENEYESWRMWAKAHLRTKQRKDDLAIEQRNDELRKRGERVDGGGEGGGASGAAPKKK